MALFPLLAGQARAAERLLFGDPFADADAVEFGVAKAVLSAREVFNHARRIVERFNSLPPGAMRDAQKPLSGLDGRPRPSGRPFAPKPNCLPPGCAAPRRWRPFQAGPSQGRVGQGPNELRLLNASDSSVAGVGVAQKNQALAGQGRHCSGQSPQGNPEAPEPEDSGAGQRSFACSSNRPAV